MTTRAIAALFAILAATTLAADEGMWRFDQLPLDAIAKKYGVRLTAKDVERLQHAPVRILSGGGGGTGTFASANGLILRRAEQRQRRQPHRAGLHRQIDGRRARVPALSRAD
jgi:hypothetical protein